MPTNADAPNNEPYRAVAVATAGTPLAGALTTLVAVREVCPPRSEYSPETLNGLYLFLTEAGEATVQAGGRCIVHRPGSLVLLRAGLAIRERVGANRPWTVRYLLLSGPWADALNGVLDERGRGAASYQNAPSHWQSQFVSLADGCFRQDEGWWWPFLGGCATLLGWAARYPASEEDGTDSLLDDLERLLDTAPSRAWSAGIAARELGMSERQLRYRFQKTAGDVPFAAWVRRRRCAAARRLLADGWSVARTAEHLGFADPYHFSRVFKAVTGQPPSHIAAASEGARRHGLVRANASNS